VCNSCNKLRIIIVIETKKKESKLLSSAKLKAPIKFTSPGRLKLTIQHQRATIQEQQLKCTQFAEKIEEMKSELSKNSCQIDSQLGNDLVDIFKGVSQEKVPPFMRRFWEDLLFGISSKVSQCVQGSSVR